MGSKSWRHRRARARAPRRSLFGRPNTPNLNPQNNTNNSVNMMSVPKPSDLSTIHDPRAKWAEVVGLSSVQQSTLACVPPLVHVPLPVACRVLYGRSSGGGGGGGVQAVAEAERADHKWQIWSTLQSEQAPTAGAGAGAAAPAPPAPATATTK
jgi:hypothetical protein